MKIDRLISVIMLLLERQKMSVAELAEICEVTPRTISRDLETINQAGIPIVSYMGTHGGVGIMESYKLEKRLFSTADVTTLLMGLGCIRSSLSGQEVTNALAKVKGLIPEQQRREIELRAGRMTIDMTPWVGNVKHTDFMEGIQQAMEQSVLLRFDYTDRQGQSSSRTVEPYRLLLKGMRWIPCFPDGNISRKPLSNRNFRMKTLFVQHCEPVATPWNSWRMCLARKHSGK